VTILSAGPVQALAYCAVGIKFVLVEFVISKFVLVEFQVVQFFPGPKNCTKQGSFVYNIRIPNFTEFIFKNSVRFSEKNRGSKFTKHKYSLSLSLT
jgi:hypothetical protein